MRVQRPVSTVPAWAQHVVSVELTPLPDNIEWQASPTPSDHILGNMSYLFGWQIAGAASSKARLQALCNNTTSLGHQKWDQIGLTSAYISGEQRAAIIT